MARPPSKIVLACSLVAFYGATAAAQESSPLAGSGPIAGSGLTGPSLALAPPVPRVIPAASALPVETDDPKDAAAPTTQWRAPLNERMAALLRALYLMSAGGNGRPFPTIPAE